MILIELVTEEGCPYAALARANLSWALVEAHVSPRWTEWSLTGDGAPARVRGFASPTILINGRDVLLRLAPDASLDGVRVPSVQTIVAALTAAQSADPDVPRHRARKRRKPPQR